MLNTNHKTNENKKVSLILAFREKSLKMTRGLLKKWGSHISQEEILSVSDLSLCEAASRFDETRKVSFVTFLFYYIKGNLIKSVIDSATINGCNRDSYLERNGEKEYSAVNHKLKDLLNNEVVDASMGSTSKTPDDELLKKELYSLGKEACLGLDDVEKNIIEKIYINGEQVLEVAKELGYSRCHISRIKRKSLEDMRDFINRKLEFEALNSKEEYLRAS